MVWVLEKSERIKEVSHVTVMNWVKKLPEKLSDTPELESIPEVGELDELQTFVGFIVKQSMDLDGCGSF